MSSELAAGTVTKEIKLAGDCFAEARRRDRVAMSVQRVCSLNNPSRISISLGRSAIPEALCPEAGRHPFAGVWPPGHKLVKATGPNL
jgi:hypothetical protein